MTQARLILATTICKCLKENSLFHVANRVERSVLNADSSSNQWANSVQTVHTVAGLYTLQFSYSYQFESSGCWLVSTLVGNWIYSHQLVSSTNGWVTVTVPDIQANTDNTGNLEIDFFCPTGSGSIHLDDYKLYAQ